MCSQTSRKVPRQSTMKICASRFVTAWSMYMAMYMYMYMAMFTALQHPHLQGLQRSQIYKSDLQQFVLRIFSVEVAFYSWVTNICLYLFTHHVAGRLPVTFCENFKWKILFGAASVSCKECAAGVKVTLCAYERMYTSSVEKCSYCCHHRMSIF